jgi:hypothetical protein
VPILPSLTQYSSGIPSQRNKTEERHKIIQTGKEEIKLFLFANNMILYLSDPKNSTGINNVKISVPPKTINIFNAIPIQISLVNPCLLHCYSSITKLWKMSICPTTVEWIMKMEFYSAIMMKLCNLQVN